MKKLKATTAIEKVARQNGVGVDEVRREIELAIGIGMASSEASERAYWDEIPRRGERPTPEEVIDYMAEKVKVGIE